MWANLTAETGKRVDFLIFFVHSVPSMNSAVYSQPRGLCNGAHAQTRCTQTNRCLCLLKHPV